MEPFVPFANETDVLLVGDLNIENRLDRVTLFGGVDLTRDKLGLETARALKEVVDAVLEVLESEALPDRVLTQPTTTVRNPFG